MTGEFDEQITKLTGRSVYDRDGKKIGKVGGVWLDNATGRPDWVTVNTGLFGHNETFVPAHGLRVREDEDLETRYPKDQVKDAPNVAPEGHHLEPEEERRLFNHYGVALGHDESAGSHQFREDVRSGEVGGVGTAGAGTEGVHPDPAGDVPAPAGVGTAGAGTKGLDPGLEDEGRSPQWHSRLRKHAGD
jgi:hypothetical protein